MRKLILFMLLVIALPTQSFAKCEAVQWPFARNMKTVTPKNLAMLPRDAVTAYLYAELAKQPSERITGLATKLFSYLLQTELNEDRAQFLQMLENEAHLSSKKPEVFPTNGICELESRMPSSIKTTKPSHKPQKN